MQYQTSMVAESLTKTIHKNNKQTKHDIILRRSLYIVYNYMWLTEVTGRYLYMKADSTLPAMCEVTVKGKGKLHEPILKTDDYLRPLMDKHNYVLSHNGPLLLTWFNYNPTMDT